MFTEHSKIDQFEEPRLYHCTKYEALKAILGSKQLLPSYCLERASFMKEYPEGAYAMVCFADLMRNEVGRHMASFHADSYIVMDKQWAREKLVAPVTYYIDNSIPSITYREWLKRLSKENKCRIWHKKRKHLLLKNATNMFVPFMKQYEGVYFDKKIGEFSTETRIFYLEREWRWCPLVEGREAYYLTKEMYLDKTRREDELNRLRSRYALGFGWNAILEIGVPKKHLSEIEDLCVNKFGISPSQARDKINDTGPRTK